jgi:hypothetical protein
MASTVLHASRNHDASIPNIRNRSDNQILLALAPLDSAFIFPAFVRSKSGIHRVRNGFDFNAN